MGNVAATVALAGGDREDINLEAVLRHSAGDALGSLGVVISGALVLAFGWDRADPITGMVIGVLILLGSWRLIKEPIDVLMEAAPEGLDVQEIGIAMASVDGVREVHDLHVWTVTSGFPALAAHVRVAPAHDATRSATRSSSAAWSASGSSTPRCRPPGEQLLELEDRRGEPV